MLEKIKEVLWRIKFEFLKNIFFEGVEYGKKDELALENLFFWIYRLNKNENIKICKFKDLISPHKEIVFPIKISAKRISEIAIIDNNLNEYYLEYSSLCNPDTYIIGMQEGIFKKDYVYEIIQGKIRFKEICILQTDENGKDKPGLFVLDDYHIELRKVSFEEHGFEIEINYRAKDREYDNKILKYLIKLINEQNVFLDVYDMAKDISQIEKNDSLIIKIKKSRQVISKFKMKNGKVMLYSYLVNDDKNRQYIKTYRLNCKLKDFIRIFNKNNK